MILRLRSAFAEIWIVFRTAVAELELCTNLTVPFQNKRSSSQSSTHRVHTSYYQTLSGPYAAPVQPARAPVLEARPQTRKHPPIYKVALALRGRAPLASHAQTERSSAAGRPNRALAAIAAASLGGTTGELASSGASHCRRRRRRGSGSFCRWGVRGREERGGGETMNRGR